MLELSAFFYDKSCKSYATSKLQLLFTVVLRSVTTPNRLESSANATVNANIETRVSASIYSSTSISAYFDRGSVHQIH